MARPFSTEQTGSESTSTTDMISSLSTAQLPGGAPASMKRKLADEELEETIAPTKKKKKTSVTGQAKKTRRKECVTCCNEVPINRFPKLPHKSAEKHGRDVCVNCWEQHLESQIKTNGWDAICCPLCNDCLEETEIKKLANVGTYGAWLDKAAKECRESDEEFRACPRADCSWGCFFSTKEDGNIFTCQLCKYRYCVLCEVKMHEGKTCAEYQRDQELNEERKRLQNQQNAASEQVVNTTSKACPKCTSRLDKYTGCDHVTCRQCKHQFCWGCFALYRGDAGIVEVGNTAHKVTCRHHPYRLPNAPPGLMNQ